MIYDLLLQFVLGGARLCLRSMFFGGVLTEHVVEAQAALRWVAYTDPTQFESDVQEHMRICDECSGRNFFNRIDAATVN